MSFFDKKVVVISGVARGIGKALAIMASQQGAIVAGADIIDSELECLELTGSYYLGRVDISVPQECDEFVKNVLRHYGKIDILINCAGITHIAPAIETQTQHFERVVNVNLMGTIYLTQSCLPHIIAQKGTIAGISSVAGYTPLLYRTAYSASKHGVWGYLTTLHAEMKSSGVNVMTISPGYVETQLQQNQQKYFSNQTQEVLTPEGVAFEILKGIENRKKLLFVGRTAKLAYWLNRFFPSLYEKIMIRKTLIS